MAKELLVSAATGLTVFAIGRVPTGDDIGKWGNVSSGNLEDYNAGNFSDYAIAMSELGASGFYEADMPTLFNPGRAVEIIFYSAAGGALLESDTKLSGSLYEQMDDWVATNALAV